MIMIMGCGNNTCKDMIKLNGDWVILVGDIENDTIVSTIISIESNIEHNKDNITCTGYVKFYNNSDECDCSYINNCTKSEMESTLEYELGTNDATKNIVFGDYPHFYYEIEHISRIKILGGTWMQWFRGHFINNIDNRYKDANVMGFRWTR